MKDVWEFYDFVKELIEELKSLGEHQLAQDFHNAMFISNLPGEVLGTLRLELIKLEKIEIGLSPKTKGTIRVSLEFLDSRLGPRPEGY